MKTFFDFLFVIAILALIVINFRTMILPNAIIYPGAGAAFLVRIILALAGADAAPTPFWLSSNSLTATVLDSLIGAFIGMLTLLIVNKIWLRARGVEVVGYGDIKMLGMIGVYLGFLNAIAVIFVAMILMTLCFLLLNAITKGKISILPSGAFWGVPAIFFAFINVNQILVWLSK